jgi:hypothetical protein
MEVIGVIVIIGLIYFFWDAIMIALGSILMLLAAIVVVFILTHIVLSVKKYKENKLSKKREQLSKKREQLEYQIDEVIEKINEIDTSKLSPIDQVIIKTYIIPSRFTNALKEITPIDLRERMTAVRSYADQNEISILDDDVDKLEEFISITEEHLMDIEVKACQTLDRNDLRFSTVNVLWSDIDIKVSEVENTYKLVESMAENIHKTIDKIIYIRDEAVIKQELGETYKQRESQLVTSIKRETQRMAKSLKGIATAFENTFDNSNKTRTEKRSNIKEEPASNRKVRPESNGYFSPLRKLNKDRLDDIGTKTSFAHASNTYFNVTQTISNYTDEELCHFVNHSTNSDLNKKPAFYYAIVTEIYLRLESGNIEASI